MGFSFLLSFTLSCCFFTTVFGAVAELWSVEQLDDMILSDAWRYDAPARTPTVIALYETQCKKRLLKYGFDDDNLPNSMHLLIASFDRLKVQQTIWYEWEPEKMDVFQKYNITNTLKENEKDWCPTILFQPANWSLPIEIYDPSKNGNLKEWIWHFLKTNVTFYNTLNEKVYLLLYSGNKNEFDIVNEQLIAEIEPLSSVIVSSYASHIIVVRNSLHKVVNRYIINTIDKTYNIEQTEDPNLLTDQAFEEWLIETKRLQDARDWSTRRRYLNNIRAPPLMPSYTEMGFKHTRLPDNVCQYVLNFWNTGENKKIAEDFPSDGTEINTREVSTYMLHIPGDKKRWIADVIRPLLEEWTGIKLVYSTMYGLREYVKGAVLKTHVDRIETHVVSAILHVKHTPENVSWPLEVVSWDGRRYYIEDNQCDMVYYESSKLIHGRPFTYNGSSWINAFLHFRPANWDNQGYVFTSDNVIKTPKGSVPLVDFIYG